MRSENEGYEPVYTGKEAHRKWRARQKDHPQHEGDECSGEEMEKGEGDALEVGKTREPAGRRVVRQATRD